MSLHSTLIGSLDDVFSEDWDRLVGTHQPFLRHAFLHALERHGCVGERWGWYPRHLLLYEGGRLLGALPQYLKTNAYGELVFDWTWAEAHERSGLPYYPKLVTAVPYTPASGRRLLIHPEADAEAVRHGLIAAAIEHARAAHVSSLHWLFPDDTDREALAEAGMLIRQGVQFHWHNAEPGYADFDDYLAHFSSAKRKKVRRERRQVAESGVEIRQFHGEQLSDAEWQVVHRHYASTFARLGGHATLSEAFFREVSRRLPGQVVVFLARRAGRPIASAICLRDADTLYGRHWGCDEQYAGLHFELCYYQGLDYCIRHGLRRFDPGAQGEHKISRGFLPTPTWSAHWIAHPGLRGAIADFLQRESEAMERYRVELGEHAPYRRN